ncbi:hypothetical protein DRN97_10930 [Methanosarcinales archaeon]|nr:MAG: hypothetical protein DRN97_10930 [Methanosarcinales archaeon]
MIETTHAGASRAPLGYGIIDIAPVEEFREEIMSTPGWENVNAIKNNRVYFISTAASSVHHCCFLLYMAKCFYPNYLKMLIPMKFLMNGLRDFLA